MGTSSITTRRPMRATRSRPSDFRRRRSPLDELDRGATTAGPWLNAGLERLRGERQPQVRTPLWAAGGEGGPKDRPVRPAIGTTERPSRPGIPSLDVAPTRAAIPTLTIPADANTMYLRRSGTGVILSKSHADATIMLVRDGMVLSAIPFSHPLPLWAEAPATPEQPPLYTAGIHEGIRLFDGSVIEIDGHRIQIQDDAIRAATAAVDLAQPLPDVLLRYVSHLLEICAETPVPLRQPFTFPLIAPEVARHAAHALSWLEMPPYCDPTDPYDWPIEDDVVHQALLVAGEASHVDPSYREIPPALIEKRLRLEYTPDRVLPVVYLMCRAGHPTILSTLHDLVHRGEIPRMRTNSAQLLAALSMLRLSTHDTRHCLSAIPTAPDRLQPLLAADPWLMVALSLAADAVRDDGIDRGPLREAVAAWQKMPLGFLAYSGLASKRLLLQLSDVLQCSALDVLQGRPQAPDVSSVRHVWRDRQLHVIEALRPLLVAGAHTPEFLPLLDWIAGDDADFAPLRTAVREWRGLDTLFSALDALHRGDASAWPALQQHVRRGEPVRRLLHPALHLMVENLLHPSHARAVAWHNDLQMGRAAIDRLTAGPQGRDIQ